MTIQTDANQRIAALKAEIAKLEAHALTDLKEKRTALQLQLRDVEEEIMQLEGGIIFS